MAAAGPLGAWNEGASRGVRLGQCTCGTQVRWWYRKLTAQCKDCKQWLTVELAPSDRGRWRWVHVDPQTRKRKKSDPDQIAGEGLLS